SQGAESRELVQGPRVTGVRSLCLLSLPPRARGLPHRSSEWGQRSLIRASLSASTAPWALPRLAKSTATKFTGAPRSDSHRWARLSTKSFALTSAESMRLPPPWVMKWLSRNSRLSLPPRLGAQDIAAGEEKE